MSDSFVPPQTPPRKSKRPYQNTQSTPSDHNGLLTPATSAKKPIITPVTKHQTTKQSITKFPFTPSTPQKSPCKSRIRKNNIGPEKLSFGLLLQSSTPRNQIINEKLAKEWNNKSSDKNIEIVDEEELENIPRAKLVNPFLEESKKEVQETKKPVKSDIDFDTHMEVVNSRTGERKVIKLTKDQMKIKPRKLFQQDN